MGATMPTLHAALHRNRTGRNLQKAETGSPYDSVEREFRSHFQTFLGFCAHGPGMMAGIVLRAVFCSKIHAEIVFVAPQRELRAVAGLGDGWARGGVQCRLLDS
jgi:hypothetical protein